MAKLDEISKSIGGLEQNIKNVYFDTSDIKKHLKELNGRVAKHSTAIKINQDWIKRHIEEKQKEEIKKDRIFDKRMVVISAVVICISTAISILL